MMNNGFCTRCGAPLKEDGTCPHCDATYSVEGIFDEPKVVQPVYNTEGSGFPASSHFPASSDGVNYAQEVPSVEELSEDVYPDLGGVVDEVVEVQPEPVYSYPSQSEPSYVPSYDNYNGNENSADDVNNTNNANAEPYVPYTEPVPPQPQEPTASKKKSGGAGEAIKDWLDCAKTFFQKEPFAAVDKVLDGGTHLWAIFAGLNVIFGAFCIAGMFGNGFLWLIDKVFGSYAMLITFYKEYTFGNLFALFLFSLLTLALLFCAVTGCEYALFSLSKKKARIETLIKLVAISFFPMTIACVAAYIFSFFLMRVAAAILFAGAIASFRLLNESIRREEEDLPFWNVVLCNVAQMVATMLIVSISLAVI